MNNDDDGDGQHRQKGFKTFKFQLGPNIIEIFLVFYMKTKFQVSSFTIFKI